MPPEYFAPIEGSINNSKHVEKHEVHDVKEQQHHWTLQESTRNLAVIAHVDHGKTTLSDALLNKAGLLHRDKVGDQNTGRSLDTMQDEKDRGITIKAAAVTLNLQINRDVLQRNEFKQEPQEKDDARFDGLVPLTINLIDSPGHIEFNAEVTAALRVSDGALVVVDALEGKAVQTDEVLLQALKEGVRPVLMINKVDRLIIDQQLSPEQIYDRMTHVVDDVNAFITTHQRPEFPNQCVSFAQGTVCFGSGYFGWSASIDSFVPYLHKEGTSEGVVRKALSSGDKFIKHIIRPIVRMHRTAGVLPTRQQQHSSAPLSAEERYAQVVELLMRIPGMSSNKVRRLLVTTTKTHNDDVSTLDPRKLLKKAMMLWLPAADAIVDMVAAHVPSPSDAQRLRAELLYSGPLDDESGRGVMNCDPNGPLVVYISKMVPSSSGADQQKSRSLLGFGRVFSGTVHAGESVRALRTDRTETMVKIKRIQVCGIGAGRVFTTTPSAQAGQLVAFEGLDHALNKAGTLVRSPDTKPIRHMTMSVMPVLRHGIRPKDKRNLTKFVTSMQQVVDADSTAVFSRDVETNEYILAGAGKLHIEVLVSSLYHNSGIEVELSEPMIAYRETVVETSDVALAKSDNKHNRIWIQASPLSDDMVQAMSSTAGGDLVGLDSKSLGTVLVRNYGWSSSDASRIWAVGPTPLLGMTTSGGGGGTPAEGNTSSGDDMDQPTCLLVDSTFGIQIPNDARENIISAFEQVTRQGVLINAPLRGVRFDVVDTKFHADSVHRRPGSVIPTAVRAMKGAFLLASPQLVEPIYLTVISGSAGSLNGVYSVLGERGGTVVDTSSSQTTDTIQATIPVRRSFGLVDSLRGATKCHAHNSSCMYGGMRLVPPNEEMRDIVVEVRKQKGLPDKEPIPKDFIDKL